MNKCIIIAGGKFPRRITRSFFKDSYIICADSGYDFALEKKIKPDLILGDFDSISKAGKDLLSNANSSEVEVFPVKKDKSDTELAIDVAIRKKFEEIYILAGIGTRLDHSFTNILSLKAFYNKNIKMMVIDDNNSIFYTEEDISLKKTDRYISFIPIEKSIISLSGFEYNLDKEELSVGKSRQISNKIIGDKAYLKVHKGGVFVFMSED